MIKKVLILATVALVSHSSWATRPLRTIVKVKQSDGTTVTVQKQGNAHFCYYATTDGVALLRNPATKDLCYAFSDGQMLKASDVVAHDAAFRTEEENGYVRSLQADAVAFVNRETTVGRPLAMDASTTDGLGQYGVSAKGIVSSIGQPVIPVVMAQFPDRKFLETTTKEKVTRMLNENGYADERYCKGSVKDYFTDQSYGMFVPTFDVTCTVTLPENYAYYGKDSGANTDTNVHLFVDEVLRLATEQGIDFSKYAIDGKVPLVSIYYAGPGQHSAYEEGCDDYLYAHYSNYSTKAGDTPVSSYLIGNELLQSYNSNLQVTGAQIDGIGVFCHEFSHALGLPDFYATTYNINCKTPDYWSVMDYGQYGADGYVPLCYTAYERSFMGWLDVEQLGSEAGIKTLKSLSSPTGPKAFCIKNPDNPNEYYILENRQDEKWYFSSFGHGMLVYHVDYNANSWRSNTVNNTASHQRYSVVPADNIWQSNAGSFVDGVWKEGVGCSPTDYQGDLFPGTTGNAELTDDSTPAATVFTEREKLGRPIYNIRQEENGSITFSYLEKDNTAIGGLVIDEGSTPAEKLYTIDGRPVGFNTTLPAGIYVKKTAKGSKKVVVR